MTLNAGPIDLLTEDATAALAARLGAILRPGDCLLLQGSIGAGKTAFARALIRSLLGRQEDVPSPTFTLVQTYDTPLGEVWHCDLYRLGHPDDALELGLDQAFEQAITLIEWPDRLGGHVPPTALTLQFQAGAVSHSVQITGPADVWQARLEAAHV